MSCKAGLRHHPIRIRQPQLTEQLPGTGRPAEIFKIDLPLPDLSAWQGGAHDIPGVCIFDSGTAGPEIVVSALVHGNEYAGACALERLRQTNPVPRSGRLTLILANLSAFNAFDRTHPLHSRYCDEDLNRVWHPGRLSGHEHSLELDRARRIRPFIQRADLLLDIHSTLWPSEPLFIVPPRSRSVELACALASGKELPALVLTDLGHNGGPRLIEEGHFMSAGGTGRSCLLEAGQHWEKNTVAVAEAAILRLLEQAENIHLAGKSSEPDHPAVTAIVTDNVLARSSDFTFVKPWVGGKNIPHAGSVIARDGDDLICTPYDNCLLIMPNHRPRRGQLAVRLARICTASQS